MSETSQGIVIERDTLRADLAANLEAVKRGVSEFLKDQQSHWAEGRRGETARRVAGFTEAETRILRMFAARGFVHYDMADALQRHMSNIRKKLPAEIVIKTVVEEGYRMDKGKDRLLMILMGHGLDKPAVPMLPAPIALNPNRPAVPICAEAQSIRERVASFQSRLKSDWSARQAKLPKAKRAPAFAMVAA